jgi:hypothetical protein
MVLKIKKLKGHWRGDLSLVFRIIKMKFMYGRANNTLKHPLYPKKRK